MTQVASNATQRPIDVSRYPVIENPD